MMEKLWLNQYFSFQNNLDENQHREEKDRYVESKKTLGIRNDKKVTPVST